MVVNSAKRAVTESSLTTSEVLPVTERVTRITEPTVLEVSDFSAYYGGFRALYNISFQIPERKITALIGPSGCGKSTLLRCMNRMNDLVPSFHSDGSMTYHGLDLYARDREYEPW